MNSKFGTFFILIFFFSAISCKDDNETPQLDIPQNYTFERDGATSVSFSGQTIRLNMLSELKTYLSLGHTGDEVVSQTALDMYANANSPFSTAEMNDSGKQLENKTYADQIANVKLWINELAGLTDIKPINAANGVAGFISRGTKDILVNTKGHEYVQFIEKGLMGSCFYDQILNGYLSDAKIGSGVDNESIVDGKNYTTMEHHWDEAFGYFGVPVDFPNGNPVLPDANDRFWAKYTDSMDGALGCNKILMDAYKKGRAAIVGKQYDVKDEQRDIIIATHELVSAAMAIHYLNEAKANLNDGGAGWQGNLFHHLSEAYQFVEAVRYSPIKSLSNSEIDEILNTDLGTNGDFWTIQNATGLNKAIDTIAGAYPELKDIKDSL